MGALWGSQGQFGALWDTMETLWESRGHFGALWDTLGHSGISVIQWGLFGVREGTFGGAFGAHWGSLGHDRCSQ